MNYVLSKVPEEKGETYKLAKVRYIFRCNNECLI